MRTASPSSGRASWPVRTLADVNDAELQDLIAERSKAAAERAPGIGGADTGAGPTHWYEHYGAKNSRAWLVVDPPDGVIPAPTAEARRAECRPRAAARRTRPGRQRRGSQPLRSLHHARAARLDDAGDLRQLVRDHPVARLGRDSLRDDSRDASHSARRAPAREIRHPELHGRRARPFRGQHARGRDDELQAGVRVSRRGRKASSSSSGSRRRRRRRWSGR